MRSNDSFLIGYISGEGSFKISLRSRGRFGVRARPAFSLESHDRQLLESARDKIGGNIYDKKYKEYDDQVRWSIDSKEDILSLVHYIQREAPTDFLLSDKGRTYLKWVQICVRIWTIEDVSDVEDIIRDAKSLNKRGYGGGRTADEWVSLLKSPD